jgi:hypothetical protein
MKLAIIITLIVFEPLLLVTAIILVEKAWRKYQCQ